VKTRWGDFTHPLHRGDFEFEGGGVAFVDRIPDIGVQGSERTVEEAELGADGLAVAQAGVEHEVAFGYGNPQCADPGHAVQYGVPDEQQCGALACWQPPGQVLQCVLSSVDGASQGRVDLSGADRDEGVVVGDGLVPDVLHPPAVALLAGLGEGARVGGLDGSPGLVRVVAVSEQDCGGGGLVVGAWMFGVVDPDQRQGAMGQVVPPGTGQVGAVAPADRDGRRSAHRGS
jgi:hypothetical protein